MTDPKVRNVKLRHHGRKYPSITFVFADGRERSFTIHADLVVAQQVFAEINRKIALRIFRLEEYLPNTIAGSTLADLVKVWFKYRTGQQKLGRITIATLAADHYTFQIFLKTTDQATHLSEITTDTIDKFCVTLLNQKNKNGTNYKPGAVNVYLRHLSSAFSFAVEKNMLLKNPLHRYKKLKTDETKRYLSRSDITKIRTIMAGKHPWQLEIFNLALYTGLRRAEIWSLRISSLVFLSVAGNYEPFLKITGKGDKTRHVPLIPPALKLIQNRVDQLNKLGQMRDKIPKRIKEEYLFWEVTSLTSINTAFKRIRIALGLDYFNPHSLRHTSATYMLESGVPITVVQAILGHSDINTTRVYAKTTEAEIVSALKQNSQAITDHLAESNPPGTNTGQPQI